MDWRKIEKEREKVKEKERETEKLPKINQDDRLMLYYLMKNDHSTNKKRVIDLVSAYETIDSFLELLKDKSLLKLDLEDSDSEDEDWVEDRAEDEYEKLEYYSSDSSDEEESESEIIEALNPFVSSTDHVLLELEYENHLISEDTYQNRDIDYLALFNIFRIWFEEKKWPCRITDGKDHDYEYIPESKDFDLLVKNYVNEYRRKYGNKRIDGEILKKEILEYIKKSSSLNDKENWQVALEIFAKLGYYIH